MTDPAVAYQPNQGYGTFDRGIEKDIFLKNPNGSLNLGVVWPGENHSLQNPRKCVVLITRFV